MQVETDISRHPVATLEVKFNCGCGFQTAKPEEAQSHAVATGHAVTLSGRMSATEEKNAENTNT